jgi:hypothetical protein
VESWRAQCGQAGAGESASWLLDRKQRRAFDGQRGGDAGGVGGLMAKNRYPIASIGRRIQESTNPAMPRAKSPIGTQVPTYLPL